MVRKILKFLFIIQEVPNAKREPKLGRGHMTARRINPYNPLSYIALAVLLVVGILLYGIVGVWKEVDASNPFKWN